MLQSRFFLFARTGERGVALTGWEAVVCRDAQAVSRTAIVIAATRRLIRTDFPSFMFALRDIGFTTGQTTDSLEEVSGCWRQMGHLLIREGSIE